MRVQTSHEARGTRSSSLNMLTSKDVVILSDIFALSHVLINITVVCEPHVHCGACASNYRALQSTALA